MCHVWTRPFDAVLCDLDGVLRRWPDLTDLDLAHDLPPGTLAAAAFAPARLLPAVTGECTDEQWRAGVEADLARTCGPARAAGLVAAWTALTGEVDPAVAALLAAARRHVPVVLVSNATTRLEADLAGLGVDLPADHVISSALAGVAKPDPRVYHLAAELAGAPVRRCLFVDDSAGNVEAADALGMTALHFERPDQLREALGPLVT
jgi:putative hydrolase of the HAD superfamily